MHLHNFKACSLWCNEGTSDKVYDMQLVPHPTDPNLASVYAQNGRRTATKLVQRVICENVSLSRARELYSEKFDEKANKHYRELPLARASATRAAENRAAIAALASASFDGAVFEWPEDLKDMVETVEEALSFPQGTTWQLATPRAVAILMMTDVSLGLAEGPYELISAIVNDRRSPERKAQALVFSQLSPSVAAGMAAQPNPVLSKTILSETLVELCKKASA